MCCSVGAVGHLCAIQLCFQVEAELNIIFVIRCGAGSSGHGVCVGVGARTSACALAVIRQPASPHWQAWGLGFESWSIIWGKEELHHLTAMGGSVQGSVCTGRCEAVAPCDLSRSRASPQPADCLVQGKVRSEGRAQCGMRSGRKVRMGGKVGRRWVASEVEEVV